MNRGRSHTSLPILLLTLVPLVITTPARADDKAALKAMIDALDTPDSAKRTEARLTLFKAAKKRHLPALVMAAKKGSPRVRVEILRCLHKFRGHPSAIEPPDVVGFLLDCLQEKDVSVRCSAISCAASFAAESPGLIKALLKALDDDNYLVASGAVQCFGWLGFTSGGAPSRPAYPKLILIAETHPDRGRRSGAITALGLLRQRDVAQRPLLVGALLRIARNDPDSWVRGQALAGLAYYNETDYSLVPRFRFLWKEERAKKGGGDPEVLEAILLAYTALGPGAAGALPDLLPYLKDKHNNPKVRGWIMSVLGRAGPAAHEALPVVRAIAEDEKESMDWRRYAQVVIPKITKKEVKDSHKQ